ncbi:unnamed protein product, partial [Ascophyllum nodosum]
YGRPATRQTRRTRHRSEDSLQSAKALDAFIKCMESPRTRVVVPKSGVPYHRE